MPRKSQTQKVQGLKLISEESDSQPSLIRGHNKGMGRQKCTTTLAAAMANQIIM